MTRRDLHQGLPPFAIEYVASVRSGRKVVRSFHAWLKRTGASIFQLAPKDLDGFVTQLLAAQRPHLRNRTRNRLLRYFEWLRLRQLLSFDPKCLWPRSFQLPLEAQRFVQSLEPTHKRSTVDNHRGALRQFHSWLASHSVSLGDVERRHVASWLEWIHARGLHPSTRIHLIQAVRAYFRWLGEQPDFASASVEDLFRRGDLPKLPQYLPRPVPADLDRVLQQRFRKSRSLAGLGLLLMRRTGLRIGELRALPLRCVHNDHRGNAFLKVPLGKLNNERLVPLDRRTLQLLAKLRRLASTELRGKRRALLLETRTGKPIPYEDLRRALARACKGLVFAEPMTSHRLRHTYATSMLAGGVSLPALMKLLGHRDYRMTLRYAAITIETVAAEHADALEKIEARYDLRPSNRESTAHATTLADVARHLLAQVQDAGLDTGRARALARRLNRLSAAIQRLLRECAAASRRSD